MYSLIDSFDYVYYSLINSLYRCTRSNQLSITSDDSKPQSAVIDNTSPLPIITGFTKSTNTAYTNDIDIIIKYYKMVENKSIDINDVLNNSYIDKNIQEIQEARSIYSL